MSLKVGYHMREEDVLPVTHSVEIACRCGLSLSRVKKIIKKSIFKNKKFQYTKISFSIYKLNIPSGNPPHPM